MIDEKTRMSIIDLYLAKEPIKNICIKHNICRSTVYNIIYSYLGRPPKTVRDSSRDTVIHMCYAQGDTYDTIAQYAQVTPGKVCYLLRRDKLTSRYRALRNKGLLDDGGPKTKGEIMTRTKK